MGLRDGSLEEEAALMGIGHLFDHTADVYRRVESLGPTYRETVTNYVRVHTAVPCTGQRRLTVWGQRGAGDRPVGDRRVYFDTGTFFEDLDIVSIVSGPTDFVGPQNLEVESIAIPRGHHIELRASEFRGVNVEFMMGGFSDGFDIGFDT